MARPSCREHPQGRVRRDGYYGKHREFVRWECVPDNGDAPHYLRHDQMAASPARRRGAHPVSGAADGRGALRAERYVARAVSQPRFAQTSSVAAALFIV